MTSKMLLFIIGLLLCVIVVGGIWWNMSAHENRARIFEANNQLSQLFPLKHINDSLAVRVASVSKDLSAQIDKNSQLLKTIKAKDEKILFLASAKPETRIDSVRIPVRYRDEFQSYFDTTDNWMTIQGFYDTASVNLVTIAMRDSLTIAVTQARNDILFGYIQNHSPYTTITNASFAIDAGQFIDKPSPYWKYAAIAGWGVIVAKIAADFFKH